MKRSLLLFGILRLMLDFGMTAWAFIIAWAIRSHTDLIPGLQLMIGEIPPLDEYMKFVLGVSTAFIGIAAVYGMYSFRNTYKFRQEFVRVLVTGAIWILLIMSFFFITRQFFFSRLVLIYGWILSLFLIIVGRLIVRLLQKLLVRFHIGISRLLLLGDGGVQKSLENRFSHNLFYTVLHPTSSIGTIRELEAYCATEKPDEILQIGDLKKEAMSADEILQFCRTHHIRYRFVPNLLDVQRTNVEVTEEEEILIIELKATPLEGWGRIIKRLFDVTAALLGILVLFPFLFVVGLLVKTTSKGPVFFRQQRVGYHGRPFGLYKFRSMVQDAEELKLKMLSQSQRKGPLFKIKDDPRITPLGKFLRAWSLDELPQLINVLKGDMSLVGPRPHLPNEVAQYAQHQKMLLTIKPGITGMAQVNGRSGLDFEDEVRFDLYYIENWSLWLDITILFKTAKVVFLRDNAD